MRIIAGLICIVLMVGCSEKDNVPSGVLGKEEMGSIIWDMMQADQYAANYIIKDSAKVNVKMETLKLYEEVFRLHKVTRDEFRKSFQFYQDHPDITRTMFDSLIARGNRMRSESYTHSPAPTPVVPAVRPAVTGPMGHPPVVIPGKPGGTLPNRPPGTDPNKPATTSPNRPSTTGPNRPAGVFPNQPGGIRLPSKFMQGKDSALFLRKGPKFTPVPFKGVDTSKKVKPAEDRH